MAAALRDRTDEATVTTVDGSSQTGGGSLPTQDIATRLVAVAPKRMSPDALALALRRHEQPVFARIRDDLVLADPRTLREGEDALLVEAVAAALAEHAEGTHAC
jgi:L-seryl-tRNA(Ser) seleniumtransferase